MSVGDAMVTGLVVGLLVGGALAALFVAWSHGGPREADENDPPPLVVDFRGEGPASIADRARPMCTGLVLQAYLLGVTHALERRLTSTGVEAWTERGRKSVAGLADHLSRANAHAYGEGVVTMQLGLRERSGLPDGAIDDAVMWALEAAVRRTPFKRPPKQWPGTGEGKT